MELNKLHISKRGTPAKSSRESCNVWRVMLESALGLAACRE
jgi:hypothetical protein